VLRPADRERFERCVRAGGVALFPADTVYGLACDPLSARAVRRLYEIKRRPPAKPAAVMFFSLGAAVRAVPELSTLDAASALLPGPVTLLVANPAHRFPLACGPEPDTLGVRVPEVPALADVAVAVLQSSANPAGGADARRLDDVDPQIRAAVDLELDGGELPGVASTVVDLRDPRRARVIRAGAMPASAVERILRSGPGRPAGPSLGTARHGSLDALSRLAPRRGGSDHQELSPDFFGRPLAEVDPAIAEVLAGELERQRRTLEMIASENFVPQAVLECQGSVLTNKYAEGYPGRRYYGGCEWVDIAEQLAIDRAKELFGAEHANVQPHAGAQANIAVYHALLEPGDRIMGLSLAHGGHLTHGMKLNVSGRLYEIVAYEVDRASSVIDMDELARLARERRPRMILAGWSAYPRQLDFERFREIADEVGAYLVVDMAHFAGLVAAGLHPSPVPFADVVTTTIHKTLGGPRSGMILSRAEHAKAIDSAVFPGQQGGPLEHVIAAKAVALRIAASEAFRERQRRTVAGARALADELLQAPGVRVLSGGTDVHLVLLDLRDAALGGERGAGQEGEDRLAAVGITVNRNAVPFDDAPPMRPSGLRIGTPALATRGLQVDDFHEIGMVIAAALGPDFEARRDELSERSAAIAERYPLYEHLHARAPA
jgi:glycine hydroxymethyltransferase